MNVRLGGRATYVLIILSFLLSTTVSMFSLHLMNQSNMRDMNRVLATQIYDHIIGIISEPVTVARTMSNDRFLAETLRNEKDIDEPVVADTFSRYLADLERGLAYQATFVVSEATGRYYTSDGINRIIDRTGGKDDWYDQFVNSDDTYVLDVNTDQASNNDLTVFVNAKVYDTQGAKKLLGICGVGVRMTGIQELFTLLEEDFNVHISLVNRNHLVQVDTNEGSIGTARLDERINPRLSTQYEYHQLDGDAFAITKYIDNLDWFLIVESEGTDVRSFATIIAFNFVLCVIVLIIMVLAFRHSRKHSEELWKASIIDHLTGLLNQRAFEEDKHRLLDKPLADDLVIVTADLNGLKTANDTLGHEAGDELIRGAASCLTSSLGHFGKIYRTGGDEFSAFVNLSENELGFVRSELEHTIASWSGDKIKSISLSVGYAPKREFPNENLQDLIRISDKRMYEEKTRYYDQMGIPRRRT